MAEPLLTKEFVAERSDGAFVATLDGLQDRVDEAIALAYLLAPCLLQETLAEHKRTLAKGVLADALVRFIKRQQSGEDERVQAQQAGPFTMTLDTRRADSLPLLTRSEEALVRSICTRKPSSIRLRVP